MTILIKLWPCDVFFKGKTQGFQRTGHPKTNSSVPGQNHFPQKNKKQEKDVLKNGKGRSKTGKVRSKAGKGVLKQEIIGKKQRLSRPGF